MNAPVVDPTDMATMIVSKKFQDWYGNTIDFEPAAVKVCGIKNGRYQISHKHVDVHHRPQPKPQYRRQQVFLSALAAHILDHKSII